MRTPILIVEENPHHLELIQRGVAQLPHSNAAVVVSTQEDALAYLLRRERHANRLPGNPAAVLLAIDGQQKRGFQLIQTLRAHPEFGSLPVVILNSSYDRGLVADAYKSGANAYVVKPDEPDAFIQAIHELYMFWGVFNVPPPAGRHSGTNLNAAAK